MKDTHKALRKAYYDALNGNLSLNASNVGVFDEISTGSPVALNTNCVFLSTQTANDASTLDRFTSEATILLDIVVNSVSHVNKNDLDTIAQQIFSIVLPTRLTNGLAAQTGLQIMLVKKESDNYFPVQTSATGLVMRRLIRFSQFIHEL